LNDQVVYVVNENYLTNCTLATTRSLLVESHILNLAPNQITASLQYSAVYNPIDVTNQAELTIWRITERNSFISSENIAQVCCVSRGSSEVFKKNGRSVYGVAFITVTA